MTEIQEIKNWVQKFPKWHDHVQDFSVDYTDNFPGNGGVFPAGTVEVERKEDVLGNVTVTNQLNFAIYWVLPAPTDDDEQSTDNVEWVSEFQRWVQSQSVLRVAPTFGDVPQDEYIKAQNGTLFSVGEDGTTAMYMIQLSATFKNYYEAI